MQAYHDLPYQAHGFNDLDYFAQLLIKGVSYFKFDVSLVDGDSCAGRSTWNSKLNDCAFYDLYAIEICCLGMRGDLSQSPVYKYPFNTSYDFVNLLNSSKYDFALKKDTAIPRYKEPKLIAINFQYNNPLSTLTQDFIYNLFKTVSDRDLNIILVFGRDQFITAYEDLCYVQKNCTP